MNRIPDPREKRLPARRLRSWGGPVRALAMTFLLASGAATAATRAPSGDAGYEEASRYVFAPGELPVIEVTLDPADFQDLLDDPWQDEYKRCTVRFSNSLIDETVRDVGIRVRGSTSRGAIKKSWKLSFNKFRPGRKFHGLEKMNLNGDRDDPSVTRSRLGMDLYRAMGVPAPRASHVRLKINDGSEVEGVFIHVEQVDEEFVRAWFGNDGGNLYKCRYDLPSATRADLRYVAPGTPETYRDLGAGEVYAEKIHDAADYGDLASLIEFIDTAPDEEFAGRIGEHIHIDDFLRAMAVEVVLGNWDGYWYGANNYYLYHNEATGLFEFVPWDLDNTFGVDYFGIDWSGRAIDSFGDGGFGSFEGALPPLIRRILDQPLFAGQIHRYALDIARGPFRLDLQEPKIDHIYSMILPYVYEGSYRNGRVDRNYTKDSFVRSYTWPAEFVGSSGAWDYGLKPYIEDRAAYIVFRTRRPLAIPKLRINEVVADNRTGDADGSGEREDWIEIYNYGPTRVPLGGMYLTDDPSDPRKWRVPGGPAVEAGGYLRIWCDGEPAEGADHAPFRLDADGEAVALFMNDENRNVLVDYLEYGALPADVSAGRAGDEDYPIRFFATPTPGAANVYGGNLAPFFGSVERETASPEDDEPLALSIPVNDLDGAVMSVVLHAGGEAIRCADDGAGADDTPRDGVWSATIPGRPEGTRVSYWFDAVDDSGATSVDPPGAPAETYAYVVEYEPPALFLNELMSRNTGAVRDDQGDEDDWVEIYNGAGRALDLGGLALSDDPDEPERFLLPTVTLEAGGFLLVWCDGEPEQGDLHAPFGLSSSGEWLGLFAGSDEGRAVIDSVSFGPLGEDESFARAADGAGTWAATTRPTPGAPNGAAGAVSPSGAALALGPNPARGGGATIFFRLGAIGRAVIRVYDVAGRERASVLDARLGPGERRVPWDLRDRSGRELPPGVYFIRLETGTTTETARFVVVR